MTTLSVDKMILDTADAMCTSSSTEQHKCNSTDIGEGKREINKIVKPYSRLSTAQPQSFMWVVIKWHHLANDIT